MLDGIQYEVVGVMRPGFQFPNADAELAFLSARPALTVTPLAALRYE